MVELVILVISVLISASIGLFVYVRNPHHIVNRLYALLTLSFVLFPIANYLSLKTTDRLLYIRAVIFFSTIAVASLYYLVCYINSPNYRLSHAQRWAAYAAVVVAALDWTPLIFKGLSGGDNPTPIPNFLAPLFLLLLAGFPTASFVALIKRIRAARGTPRLQYLYMLVGIAPLFLFAPLTSFILPVVLKNASLIGLSPIYSLTFVLGIGFAIIRHRLFDIRFFAVRAAAYLSSLFIVIFVLVLPIILIANRLLGLHPSRAQLVALVIGSAMTLYVFQYVRQFFDRATARIFFRHDYDVQDLLSKLGDILVRTADADALRLETAFVLQTALRTDQLKYVLFNGTKADSRLAVRINEGALGDPDAIDVDEGAGAEGYLLNALRDEGIALAIKLRTKHEDLGFMVVGYRRSGEGYTARDKQFLIAASGEIAIGLQNALRFQEIEKFNETLQEKIDDATRKLRRANDKLRKLNETKDDFISMASHQLRTPLTSVKGYVSMVLDGDAGKITRLQRRLLNQSFVSAQRMVYLISDLLNVSRLKTGKFIIEPVRCNLAMVIQEEVEQLQETAKGRHLELKYQKPEHFPVLMLDETKLRQVIMNFLDNAVYYTPAGGHIEVHLLERSQSIEFSVVDDGIGVPRHEQHHLFTKFFRAPNAKRARPDGTGLGLFMAKKVIIAQGGAVIFKSLQGRGSTFGFTFAKTHLLPENYRPLAPLGYEEEN